MTKCLLGASDEITDVTRVSEMVRKQRLIYRIVSFGLPKDFGHYRECTGSDEWVLGFYREGATHPGENPIAHGWRTSPWWAGEASPIGLFRPREKIKGEKKEGGGKEGRDSTF